MNVKKINEVTNDLRSRNQLKHLQKKYKQWFLLSVGIVLAPILIAFVIIFLKEMQLQESATLLSSPRPTVRALRRATPTYYRPTITAKPTPTSAQPVSWQDEPEKIQPLTLFSILDKYYPQSITYQKSFDDKTELSERIYYQPKSTYYRVGHITQGEYADEEVYLAVVKDILAITGKCLVVVRNCYQNATKVFLFLKLKDGQDTYIISSDYDGPSLMTHIRLSQKNQQEPKSLLSAKYGLSFNEKLVLDPLDKLRFLTIQVLNDKYDLALRGRAGLFIKDDKYFLGKTALGGTLYSSQDTTKTSFLLSEIMNVRYFIRLPSGIVMNTELIEYNQDNTVSFDWLYSTDAPENATIYYPAEKEQFAGGVGGKNDNVYSDYYGDCIFYSTEMNSTFLDFFDKNTVSFEEDLIILDRNEKGSILYEWKDKKNPIYSHFFTRYQQEIASQIERFGEFGSIYPIVTNIDKFIQYHPLLIWENGLGVKQLLFLERFTDNCGGEPLIYLYPKQPSNMVVSIDGVHLVKTKPQYNLSWKIKAEPEGTLTDLTTRKKYPYLFWEGTLTSAQLPYPPTITFKTKQENITSALFFILGQMGLSKAEVDNFVNYWQKRLDIAPYYELYFWDATILQQTIPLKIIPKPDTLIRVMMDYRLIWDDEVDENSLDEIKYQSPNRNGFTVVEAGGIIRGYEY